MLTTPITRLLIGLHAAYLLIGGAWPLVHMPSFEAVTGPKDEHWLVRSVAGILIVISITLFAQLGKGRIEYAAITTAMGASFVLAMVGIITAIAAVISPIYLVDGAVHFFFFACWCIVLAGDFGMSRSGLNQEASNGK